MGVRPHQRHVNRCSWYARAMLLIAAAKLTLTVAAILLFVAPMLFEFAVWWRGLWWHGDEYRDPRNGL